jgi:hypothetical protein
LLHRCIVVLFHAILDTVYLLTCLLLTAAVQSNASKLAAGAAKPNNQKTHECFWLKLAKNWQSQVSQEFNKNIA